jgi:hypothetical protein
MREDENSSGQIERERELQNQLTITIESEENNEATMTFNADDNEEKL